MQTICLFHFIKASLILYSHIMSFELAIDGFKHIDLLITLYYMYKIYLLLVASCSFWQLAQASLIYIDNNFY